MGPAMLARPMPLRSVQRKRVATSTPATVPRPPLMSTPPSTTEVMMARMTPLALSPRAEPNWPTKIQAPRAAVSAATT